MERGFKIIGHVDHGQTTIATALCKNNPQEIVILGSEDTKDRGINLDDLKKEYTTYTISNPIIPHTPVPEEFKTGKQKRRERRKNKKKRYKRKTR